MVRAVTANDKPKAISYASADTAADADKWFDVIHGEFEKGEIGTDVPVNPALFSGNAERDAEITLLVVLAKAGSANAPVTITLPMKKDGDAWKFDATKGLEGAARAAQAPKAGTSKTTNKR